MQTIFVVLSESGRLDAIHSNDEIQVKVLRKGRDDAKIDEVESTYDEVEI
jgi:hypothetical protein